MGLKFFENRNNPDAFEPVPTGEPEPAASLRRWRNRSLHCGCGRTVVRCERDARRGCASGRPRGAGCSACSRSVEWGSVPAPLAGNVVKVLVNQGDSVAAGDVVVILEAMKMETEVRASEGGVVSALAVREGDAVKVGDTLLRL